MPSKKKWRAYNYHNKKGDLINVKPHKVTYHSKGANRKFETERMIRGEMRKVVVTVRNGKEVHIRVLDDQRKAQPISYAEAKKRFEKQSARSQAADKRTTAKEVFKKEEITTKYLTSPNKYDVEGLDTVPPGAESKPIKEIEKVEIPESIKETTDTKTKKISEAEKQLYQEIKDRLPKGHKRDIITPTAWARDNPNKSYELYLLDEKLKLDNSDLYNKRYWNVSQKLLSPEEFKKEGISGAYADYALPIIELQKEESKQQGIEREKQNEIERKEKEKAKEAYLEKVKNAQTIDELLAIEDPGRVTQYGSENWMDHDCYILKNERIDELQRKKIELEKQYDTIDIDIPRWNAESYDILTNARGHDETFTSDEVFGKRNNKIAQITGSDPQWGLSRSWMGETEWSKSGRPNTTYSVEELKKLQLGSIIEVEGRRAKYLYKKTDDNEWKLISKREGGGNEVYGVIQKQKVQGRSQQDLQVLIEHSTDFGTRAGAVKEVKDIDYLKDIAITDENYRLRSEAYKRLKELKERETNEKKKAKIDKDMAELREYFQQSKEQHINYERIAEISIFDIKEEKGAQIQLNAIRTLEKDSRLSQYQRTTLAHKRKLLIKAFPNLK